MDINNQKVAEFLEAFNNKCSGIKDDSNEHIKWFYRANDTATAILSAFDLERGLTFDELITKFRTPMGQNDEDITLEYRKETLMGPIGVTSSNPEFIKQDMAKYKQEFDNVDWKSMSKEEIIRQAAKLSYDFVRIHPYKDGNGRTSRMILDYLLHSNGVESPVLFTDLQSKLKAGEVFDFCNEGFSKPFEDFVLSQYQKQFKNDKIQEQKPAEITKKEENRQKVLNESIILIGPAGSGKSLISTELSKKTGLPVIDTDIMRHCPKTIDEIKNSDRDIIEKLENLDKKLISCDDSQQEDIKKQIADLKNSRLICAKQIETRTLLPNLPNYEDMGFNGEVSDLVKNKYGIIAWHFYQKQFENQLLQALTQQLDSPCIVDMGSGMAVSLDMYYKDLSKKFKKVDPELYLKNFDLSKIGAYQIAGALHGFKNIVNLNLPNDFKYTMQKAAADELNTYFISTRQYQRLATSSVDIDGLINGNTFNPEVLAKIVGDIQQNTKEGVERL